MKNCKNAFTETPCFDLATLRPAGPRLFIYLPSTRNVEDIIYNLGDQPPVPNTKENEDEETSTVKKEVDEKDQGKVMVIV